MAEGFYASNLLGYLPYKYYLLEILALYGPNL
jgi:hypothetical protein